MRGVAGRTAFITGGASGIGLAMADVFADAGLNVVVADSSREHLEAARPRLETPGRRVHFVELDVTDRAGWQRAADEAERVFGNVHLLCNNAGVNVIRDVNDAAFEDFDWLMSVNYFGTVNGVLTFLPRMKAHNEDAHIVNTSSIAGIEAGPGVGVEPDVRASFEEMLAAFTNDAPDPELERLEDTRRQRKPDVLAAAAHRP